MAVSKRTRIIIILIVVAVVGYFAWNWYQNNQSQVNSGDSTGESFGSNLNSPAPVLEGGDDSNSSDNSAPGYNAGTETVNVTLPNGDQSVTGVGQTVTPKPAVMPNPTIKSPVQKVSTGAKVKAPVKKK
jgi:hypothetical protein